jgi:pentatricopeptide repeat protein
MKYQETAPFGQKRSYGLHEGRDIWSELTKKAPIYNLFDGIIGKVFTRDKQNKDYGIKVAVRTNPKFKGGADVEVSVEYAHLHEVDLTILERDKLTGARRFIKAGEQLGLMGNTGNCYTHDGKGGWRKITPREQADSNFVGGVHLHYHCKVYSEEDALKLVEDMKKKKIVANTYYIKQWNRFYFDPLAFEMYMKIL